MHFGGKTHQGNTEIITYVLEGVWEYKDSLCEQEEKLEVSTDIKAEI